MDNDYGGCSMRSLLVLFLTLGSGNIQAEVVTFDDLESFYTLTGSNYAGLTWEYGNTGHEGNQGSWGVGTTPYIFGYHALNRSGATLMGISFGEAVNVSRALFSGQGGANGWATAVRVHGYFDGNLTDTTDWFYDIDEWQDWFAINLTNVDRIVIESQESIEKPNTGFYGLDNLTYSVVPLPQAVWLFGSALAGLGWLRRKQTT
jgi:hypothetical protein